jgi:hypothetical protein
MYRIAGAANSLVYVPRSGLVNSHVQLARGPTSQRPLGGSTVMPPLVTPSTPLPRAARPELLLLAASLASRSAPGLTSGSASAPARSVSTDGAVPSTSGTGALAITISAAASMKIVAITANTSHAGLLICHSRFAWCSDKRKRATESMRRLERGRVIVAHPVAQQLLFRRRRGPAAAPPLQQT